MAVVAELVKLLKGRTRAARLMRYCCLLLLLLLLYWCLLSQCGDAGQGCQGGGG